MSDSFEPLFGPKPDSSTLEIDDAGTIVCATGDCASLMGLEADALVGQVFSDFVGDADRPMLHQLIRIMRADGYANRQAIALNAKPGEPETALLNCRPAERDGRYVLELRRPLAGERDHAGVPTGSMQYMIAAHGPFLDYVSDTMSAGTHDNLDLTLLEMRGLGSDALAAAAGPNAVHELRRKIEGSLRAYAVDGRPAMLDADHYGVLHRPTGAAETITAQIEHLVEDAGMANHGLALDAATLSMDDQGLAPDQISDALEHALNQFVEQGIGSLTFDSLTGAHHAALEDVATRLAQFQSALASDGVRLHFRPIVALADLQPHFLETKAMLLVGGKPVDPATLVDLPSDRLRRSEIDLALFRETLRFVAEANAQGTFYRLGLPISGYSLTTPGFMDSLAQLWQDHEDARRQLILLIDEFPDVSKQDEFQRALTQFQTHGHTLCLDDFSAALISLDQIRSLGIAFVRLGRRYSNALIANSGNAETDQLIGNLLDAWTRIGVTAIADGIDDSAMLHALRARGLTYGAGGYIGAWSDRADAFGNVARSA